MAKDKKVLDTTSIDNILGDIQKKYGEGVAVDIETHKDWKRIPCLSPTLGWIYGKGGTPQGAIIELYGPESSGKSLIAQLAVADFQKAEPEKIAVYIDTENSFNAEWAETQGVIISKDRLIVLHPDTGEDAWDLAIDLIKSGKVNIVVFDSLAAALPSAEAEGSMHDAQMGLQARMINKGLRKITGAVGRSEATLILINQIRMKIGVMFGSPEIPTGGNGPKFYSSIRCEVRKGEKLEDKDNENDSVKGIYVKIKNIKNKTSVPFRKGQIFLSFETGVDYDSEYLDFAVSYELIHKGGAWYSIGDDKIGQGKPKALQYLKEHKELFDDIKHKVLEKMTKSKDIDDLVTEDDTVEENNNPEENLADIALDED